jgi:hypothetical protein
VKGKATGPDRVFTDLLLSAGDNIVTAIHKLFQASYERGEIPKEWKTAEVKFPRKPGKTTYHMASAYRPISQTSCLGKCLERILTRRLCGFAEHNKLLDGEQEGFRQFRNTPEHCYDLRKMSQ